MNFRAIWGEHYPPAHIYDFFLATTARMGNTNLQLSYGVMISTVSECHKHEGWSYPGSILPLTAAIKSTMTDKKGILSFMRAKKVFE